ncbi:MAG: phenylpropionate dioxygenase-like ring-hydroxylating dioxygenase large terminal subunit [Dinoroseobacter sp.]|jgi:phenylpropionate dioxygenase-like ring-hydroxylating dioxygenase large terminal subunit
MKHWLKQPYHGYLRNHDVQEDVALTQVGPGTPGGEYLRRTWQPVALSDEFEDLPLLVKVLGEELVLFRTKKGQIGLIEKRCPHRGVSLEYGVPSDEGIKCCYHGWHFAPDGTILDTPNCPESKVRESFCHGAYPVQEHKGIVFAYMGPPADQPKLPILDTYQDYHGENTLMVPYSLYFPCNWLQIAENTQDPIHSVFLHTSISGAQFDESWGVLPVVQWVKTPLGMMNINVRRWKEKIWLRTTETILPNYNQTGSFWERPDTVKTFQRVSMTRIFRPIDDTHTRVMGWRYFNEALEPDGKGDPTAVGKDKIDAIGQIDDRDYETQQRSPGDYEAIKSQGSITIHERETPVASDRGVLMMRSLVREGGRAVQSGQPYTSLPLDGDEVVPTYTQDSVITRPILDGLDDRKVQKEYGKKFGQLVLDSVSIEPEKRKAFIEKRLQTLFVNAS